jgi:hypothetical protein
MGDGSLDGMYYRLGRVLRYYPQNFFEMSPVIYPPPGNGLGFTTDPSITALLFYPRIRFAIP